MATISVGHQVYLYQLFVRELGVGRQAPIARVDEVLAADDIMPCDLGCADTRELLEKLSGFVRLTVFKKGRVYATVVAQPVWDEALARADKGDPAGKRPADKGAKAWKRRRNRGEIQPVRPRPKNRPKPAEEPVEEPVEEASTAEDVAKQTTSAAVVEAKDPTSVFPTAEGAALDAPAIAEQKPELASDAVAEPEQEAAPAPGPVAAPEPEAAPAPAPEAVAGPEQEAAPAPGPVAAPEQESAPTPAPAPAPTPAQESEPEPDAASTPVPKAEPKPEPAPEPEPRPEPEAAPKRAPEAQTSQQEHPRSFAEQVQIGNEQLSALYQVLPLDVDPMELLDEDWRVARSTASYSQSDGIVTFPLRYVRTSDGEPVRVSMRRGVPTTTGKRWSVTHVEGEPNVALEGLPVANIDATRELAQFALLGPWNELVSQLDLLRAPAFGPADDELQEYLSITFHRVRQENKLVTYANGSRLAFDTGLLTTDAQSILMRFTACEGDIAWRFSDFCTAGQANAKHGDCDIPTPEPAQYLTMLADVTISSEADVRIRKELVDTYGPRLEEAAQTALRRVRRDYRLGTPAYDPIADQLRLLVPLCLEDKGRVDHALVLVPPASRDQHVFVASAVLSLARAATCARVVSLELPRWMDTAN